MRKLLPLLVLASIIFISSSAFAGSTWTIRLGYYTGITWVYSTSISYDGTCGTNCKKYYSSSLNLCPAEGVYAQVRDTGYDYYNYYYSLNDGYSWNSGNDSEGAVWISPYWYHYGYDQSHYSRGWYAPGNCEKVSYMKLWYRYSGGETIYSREFEVHSCDCIE